MTLGVLLVHGIGTQRRGDTLLQAGGALHRWVQCSLRSSHAEVEAVETDVSPADFDPGTPAHSRLIIRSGPNISPASLFLAECHWATVFRAPTYRELVRWAWLIAPTAGLLHLAPRFRQALDLSATIAEVSRTKEMSRRAMRMFEKYVGRAPRRVDKSIDPWDLVIVQLSTLANLLALIPFTMVLALAGVALLLVLTVLALVAALLPFATVRQFIRNVQLKLAETVGDSCLYVSSPITASAILTRLQRDLAWLAERCDQVVIVAHSQGAAVAYDAIRRWMWMHRQEPKLTHLITYGSGLRKLFDLREAADNSFHWVFFGVVAVAVSSMMIILTAALGAVLPGLLAAFSLAAAFQAAGLLLVLALLVIVGGGLLLAASNLANTSPVLLTRDAGGCEWENFYASHDPVPNGPTTVRSPSGAFADVLQLFDVPGLVDQFSRRQHQVTNRRSVFTDHTTYWECDDDFVARIATRLLGLAGLTLKPEMEPWLAISAERRRWRVHLRNSLGAIAALVAVLAVAAPRVTGDAAAGTRELFGGASIPVFGLTTWTIPSMWVPEWLFRSLALVIAVAIAYLPVRWAFHHWERRERSQVFDMKGYSVPPVVKAVVCAGWVAVAAAVPVAARLLGLESEDLRLQPVWPVVVAVAGASWGIAMARLPPGSPRTEGLRLLQQGEEYLRAPNPQAAGLSESKSAFVLSKRLLEVARMPVEVERAERGLAEVEKRLATEGAAT